LSSRRRNFNSRQHFNRPALLLNNGTIYVAFGSHGGRLQTGKAGCLVTALQLWLQTFVWSASDPSGCNGAALWHGGAGPAADASGNVYVNNRQRQL